MTTFVLVHGACHGGWSWQRVSPLLRAAGHDVYAPSLSGLGDRVHLATPTVGLETHIADVRAVIEYEDLTGVVLVGHSYAGMVIAGVADEIPERLAHLVFVDAVVPEDGESLLDITDPATVAVMERRAAKYGEGWLIPVAPAVRYGVIDPVDAAWVDARLVPQPLKPFRDKVQMKAPAGLALPRTYIACTGKDGGLVLSSERARGSGWRWREIETGHDCMITKPAETANLLVEAGVSPRS